MTKMTPKTDPGSRNAENMKPFVYLIQSESEMPYPDLPDDGNDIILLTWKQPSGCKDAIFYPGSSWNEGRNRLLQAAIQRNAGYLYYIFLDGDCIVKEDTELAESLHIPICGNPFRTFEAWLLEWEPAVGYTHYSWQYAEAGAAVNLGHNIDALFNAFHRETLSFLMPYYTGFDSESWLYSQHILNHLITLLYHTHRIQCNVITIRNQTRKSYAHRKKYWSIPSTFLVNAIRSDLKYRIDLENPNSIYPPPGKPEKKSASYRISEDFIRKHFDEQHPLIRHRRLGEESRPPVFLKQGSRTAVCMSGRCQGLDIALPSLQAHLLSRIGDYDLFVATPKDAWSHLAERLAPTGLDIAEDVPLDEGGLVNGVNCRLKAGVQPYLQQLYGLEKCNRLRIDHEKKTGVHYDCVIRCRPDVMFISPVEDITSFNLSYVYVPDFHAFDGVNDRFAIGNPHDMNIYMNKLDEFHAYVKDWFGFQKDARAVSAEMFTAAQLRHHGVSVRTYPFRFNRVRPHGVKHDIPDEFKTT
jgi:hypothetical protein